MDKIKNIFNQFLHRFHPNEIAGLEIFVHNDGVVDLHLVILKKKKEELIFSKKVAFVPDFETLKTHLPKDIPVVIVLNGKGILHKKLETLPADIEQIPQAILPNATAADFSFQVLPQATSNWVSLMRKAEVEKWVQSVQQLDFQVVGLAFGGFSSQVFYPMIENASNPLNTGYFNFTLSNDQTEILQLSKNPTNHPTNIFIGEEVFSNILLTAGGAAFQHLLQQPSTIYQNEVVETAATNFRYTYGFKKLGWTLLIATFGLLLVNFLAFSWLHNQTQQQQNQLVYHQTQLNQLDTLQRQLQEKQSFFKDNKLLQSSKVSFYSDEIGNSLPSGIQLTTFQIFPDQANQQQKREKLFLFDKTKLIIKGNSRRSTILNEWIKTLKSLDWIKSVKVLPYAETKGGVGEFELELLIQ